MKIVSIEIEGRESSLYKWLPIYFVHEVNVRVGHCKKHLYYFESHVAC